MANTYTQLNVHAVFSVKGRGNFIAKKWSEELFKYLVGTLKETKKLFVGRWGLQRPCPYFF